MRFFCNLVLSVAVLLTALANLVLSKRVNNLKHELTLVAANGLDLSMTYTKDKAEFEKQLKELKDKLKDK